MRIKRYRSRCFDDKFSYHSSIIEPRLLYMIRVYIIGQTNYDFTRLAVEPAKHHAMVEFLTTVHKLKCQNISDIITCSFSLHLNNSGYATCYEIYEGMYKSKHISGPFMAEFVGNLVLICNMLHTCPMRLKFGEYVGMDKVLS